MYQQFVFFSILFQILFNFSLIYSILSFPNINLILLVISMIFLAFFLIFSEKVQNKKIKITFLAIQILFSFVFNYILLIFLILMLTIVFKDSRSSFNIFKITLFFIFFLIPFVHQPIQEIITEKVIDFFEPIIKKIVLDQIRNYVSINTEYIKNIATFGFDFAVNNLEIKDSQKVINIKRIMLENIENQSKILEKAYIENYYKNIIFNIKEIIKQNKLFVSLTFMLFIYSILYIYLLFVSMFYEIFKKIIAKRL